MCKQGLWQGVGVVGTLGTPGHQADGNTALRLVVGS